MAGKFYAVRKGTVTGIFRTWEECKKNVHGYSGAEYKSFKTLEEAEAYMKGGAVTEEVTDTVPIYVDGSYNKVTKEFSYGMENHIPAITIYHDYEGIAKWCLGDWKTNKEGTKAYKAFYEEASKEVSIRFQKVTGHSGDHYNDLADHLAKKALGID